MPTSFDFKALVVKAELLTVEEAEAFAEVARATERGLSGKPSCARIRSRRLGLLTFSPSG